MPRENLDDAGPKFDVGELMILVVSSLVRRTCSLWFRMVS